MTFVSWSLVYELSHRRVLKFAISPEICFVLRSTELVHSNPTLVSP